MSFSSIRDGVTAALGRLLDALCDPQRRTRTVLAVFVAYCAVWTLYAVVAKASQDMHFDMGEMVAWSREAGLGTPKHPPLPAWIVGVWFRIFPLQTWAYDLLAVATAAVALGIAWVVWPDYLDERKRSVALALLTLVPFFNFHALKYNANSAMMPWWALVTWAFLRSFETRSLGFAALAGLAAAGAMMTKYWSIVLLAALAIAALIDQRRWPYFASPAPYITIAVGAVALAPHAWWLYAHDFEPFGYATQSHPSTVAEALLSGVGYIAGALAYGLAPIALVFAAARPSRSAVADLLWPKEPPRRLANLVFVLPLVLPILLAAAASEKVVSLWAIGGMTLLPVVLMSSPRVVISRAAAIAILGVACTLPLLSLLAAPVIALWTHHTGVPNYGDQYRLVAAAADRVWRDTTKRPLRIVGSYNNVLYGTLFYFPERPTTYEIVSPYLTPWVDAARIAGDGVLIFCPAAEVICMKPLDEWAARSPQARRQEVTISRDFLGIPGPPTLYVILAIPPQAGNH